MNGLPQHAYVMSEPHLSGYRVIIGYETLADAQAAQLSLAKPQAREDAQPVAYEIVSYETYSGAVWISPDKADEYRTKYGCVLRPLYTRPALDALRVAVEALEPFALAFRGLSSRWEDHETHWQDATSPIAVEDLRRADQAPAALQAEQGAK